MIATTVSFLFFVSSYVSPCVSFVSPNTSQNSVQRQNKNINSSFGVDRNVIYGLKSRDISLSMANIPIQDLLAPALIFGSVFAITAKPELLDVLKDGTTNAVTKKEEETNSKQGKMKSKLATNNSNDNKSSAVGSKFFEGLKGKFSKKTDEKTKSATVESVSEPAAEENPPADESLSEPESVKKDPVEEDPEPVEEIPEQMGEDPKPVEEDLEPVEEDTKPVEGWFPVDPKPVEEDPEPVEEDTKPVEEDTKPVKEDAKPVEENSIVQEETEVQTINIADARKMVTSTRSGEEEKSRRLKENTIEVVDDVQGSEETSPVPEPTEAAVEDNVTKRPAKRKDFFKRILKKVIMPWKKFSDIQ